MKTAVEVAIAGFGAAAKQGLSNIFASGEPEDQLRAPFEQLLSDMAALANIPRAQVAAVGESSLRDLKTHPDYAITVHSTLAGFVENVEPVVWRYEVSGNKRAPSVEVPDLFHGNQGNAI